MNIYEKLSAVQQELKAPKDKKNTFAGYNYRSAEGILEAVKPILAKHNATIVLSDEIVEIGGRIYVKATAAFFPTDSMTGIVDSIAYAREAESKKGLDDSQITGVASSYARKYALNGLLLIDDTKDADTDEYQRQTQPKKKETPEDVATMNMVFEIRELAQKAKVPESSILTQTGCESLSDFDGATYSKVKSALLAKIHVKEG